jgi:hypothetical protein
MCSTIPVIIVIQACVHQATCTIIDLYFIIGIAVPITDYPFVIRAITVRGENVGSLYFNNSLSATANRYTAISDRIIINYYYCHCKHNNTAESPAYLLVIGAGDPAAKDYLQFDTRSRITGILHSRHKLQHLTSITGRAGNAGDGNVNFSFQVLSKTFQVVTYITGMAFEDQLFK